MYTRLRAFSFISHTVLNCYYEMTEYSGVNTYCENQCNEGLKVQISNTMSVLKECQIMPYTTLYSV